MNSKAICINAIEGLKKISIVAGGQSSTHLRDSPLIDAKKEREALGGRELLLE